MPRKFVLCLLAAGLAFAQMTVTVEQLISFIQTSIQKKYDDRQVAAQVQRMRLTNRLDDRSIEELRAAGAGPKTVAALHALRDASANLAPAAAATSKAPAAPIPPPGAAEQKQALAEATDFALNYEKNLPNFICTQVTRRYDDPRGQGSWRALDTVNEHLTYFDHHEEYKVISRNNQPVTVSHEKLPGAKSSGEFGSIMKAIFAPETGTRFGWDHWGTLRGERMQVYSYRVPLETSNYHIEDQERGLNIVTGYSGLIYLDSDHHFVHRITLQAEDIPASFPVRELNITLDYDFEKIGDAEYLLPLQFSLRSRDTSAWVKNDVDFHFYRKFGTESTITFDTPPPISEEKTKETPPKKQ